MPKPKSETNAEKFESEANALYQEVREIINGAKQRAKSAVHSAMADAYQEEGIGFPASIRDWSESNDLANNPFALEFLGLPDAPENKANIKDALLTHLQNFLLESDRGFSLAARQENLTIDGDHFTIDLVFYNRLLRCFVLIDLKMGKLTHQDLGQMQLYTNYYTREIREEHENPAIGILLCADKNEAVVRYTLPENQSQIFASRYALQMPTEAELKAEIERETARLQSLK